MITKYRTRSLSWAYRDCLIEPVECTRETAACVFIAEKHGESRRNKISDWDWYHDTWEAARDHLLAKGRRELDAAHKRVESAKADLECVERLTKPEGAQ